MGACGTESEKRRQSTYPLDWVDNGWTGGSWTMPLDASPGSAAVAPCHQNVKCQTIYMCVCHCCTLTVQCLCPSIRSTNWISLPLDSLLILRLKLFVHFSWPLVTQKETATILCSFVSPGRSIEQVSLFFLYFVNKGEQMIN